MINQYYRYKYSLPFESFIKRNVLSTFQGFEDQGRAIFFPPSPSVWFNASVTNFEHEGELLVRQRKEGKFLVDSTNMFFSSLYHEVFHCYSILGSSLGFLYHYTSYLQKLLTENILKSVDNLSLYDIYNPDIQNYLEVWYLAQELDTLFHSTMDSLHISQLKDFSVSLYNFLVATKFHHDIRISLDCDVNIREVEFQLFNEILLYGKSFPDALKIDPNSPLPDMPDAPYYNPNLNCYVMPTNQIIDGYANHIETLVLMYDMLPLFQDKKDLRKVLSSLTEERWGDDYKSANKFLAHYLCLINATKSADEVNATCLCIYELSLMTRLHPYLLYKNEELNIDEILVPRRYSTLVTYFSKNMTSISDFCDPSKDLMKGLDRICSELNWLKYSDCLKEIYALYDTNLFKGDYFAWLSRYIINKKLNGEIFPGNYNYLAFEFPIPLFFDDNVQWHRFDLLEQSGFSKQYLYWEIIDSVIKHVLGKEMVCGNSIDHTKHYLRKLAIIPAIGPKEINKYLKNNGLDRFLNLDEILS